MRTPSAAMPFLALAASIPAQWQPMTPGTAGLDDPFVAAAGHDASGQIVAVGGLGSFVHEGARRRAIAGPTPVRSGAAMAYDRARNRVVLFGGTAAAGGDLGDTWEYDGLSWIQRTPPASPPPRTHTILVHDTWRQRTVLLGGFAGGLGLGDTWEWNGTTWTGRTVNIPGLRGAGCGTFDEYRGLMHIFGGSTTLGGPIRYDHWQFDGVAWARILQPTMPPGRLGSAMVFDGFTGDTFLFGGDAGGGALLGDTWRWDGGLWAQLAPVPAPSAHAGHAMAYDARRHRAVMLGGQSATGARDERWTLTADPRALAATYGPACGSRQLTAATGSLPELGSTFVMNVGGPANLLFIGMGFSNVSSGGAPLPLPLPSSGACQLWIDPISTMFLVPSGAGTHAMPIPAQSGLAGVEIYIQTVEVSPGGAVVFLTSNGLETRLGTPVPAQVTSVLLDPATTDSSASALAASVVVGGDGRHGSFDPTVGTQVAPSVFEFDTDNTVIPGRLTLSNNPELVANGQYYFTDFVIPAGTVARFHGNSPAVIHVRGSARIDGTLDCSGATMTTFLSRGPTAVIPGQAGGRAGAGGGRGGQGGDRCQGLGPLMVGGVNQYDGRRGSDVRVAAGHAYAGQTGGTGGPGALLFPASGLNSSITFTMLNVFSGQITSGGGGGGFRGTGGAGAVQPQANLVPGPNTPGGQPFNLPVVPGGTTSLAHYLVGGSGGGGGSSHCFLAILSMQTDQWRAGGGGSGGGGALALRCGRDVLVGNTGRVEARGGAGAMFSIYADGLPSPGGGGSGGSLLLQATGALQNNGTLDVSGAAGSRIDQVTTLPLAAVSFGGAGVPGLIRLESPAAPVTGTTVPVLVPSDIGPLLDTDPRSGMRSTWLPVGTPADRAVLMRYELTVTWNGNTITFSDDPAFGAPISDPLGPIVARFQGAPAGAGGTVEPALAGPWRTAVGNAASLDSCNRDAPHFVRIDLQFPAANRPVVQGFRLFWR